MSAAAPRHTPVLLESVLAALAPTDGATYIDATFGAGGYARALLTTADCRVLALDRDPHAIASGRSMVAEFGGRLTLVEAPFGRLGEVARERHAGAPMGVVFDLGVSSMQLDEPGRGFSFRADGPLDMRMGGSGPTAADFLAGAEEAEIADVLYRLGEERRSRAIARAICAQRERRPVTRTLELAGIVAHVLGTRHGAGKHPATRTFQALRMHINDELGEIERGLAAAAELLAPGGRLAVVTFHSLEDRLVKRFLNERAGRVPAASRHRPDAPPPAPHFRIVNPRPVSPSEEEVKANPRARSAKLRIAERL